VWRGRKSTAIAHYAVNPRKARVASAFVCASCAFAAGNPQPFPVRITSIVWNTSTPEARSTAASIVTRATSESGISAGFRFHIRNFRWRVAVPASLSSVSVVEPDFSTSCRGAFSVTGIRGFPAVFRWRRNNSTIGRSGLCDRQDVAANAIVNALGVAISFDAVGVIALLEER
jgi:hypothetical protein